MFGNEGSGYFGTPVDPNDPDNPEGTIINFYCCDDCCQAQAKIYHPGQSITLSRGKELAVKNGWTILDSHAVYCPDHKPNYEDTHTNTVIRQFKSEFISEGKDGLFTYPINFGEILKTWDSKVLQQRSDGESC